MMNNSEINCQKLIRNQLKDDIEIIDRRGYKYGPWKNFLTIKVCHKNNRHIKYLLTFNKTDLLYFTKYDGTSITCRFEKAIHLSLIFKDISWIT